MQDACQHGSCELAMSLLRVGCTMPALRPPCPWEAHCWRASWPPS